MVDQSPFFMTQICYFYSFIFRFLINCFDFLHICSLFYKLIVFFSYPVNFSSLFNLLIPERSTFISWLTWALSYIWKIKLYHTWHSSVWKKNLHPQSHQSHLPMLILLISNSIQIIVCWRDPKTPHKKSPLLPPFPPRPQLIWNQQIPLKAVPHVKIFGTHK